MTSLTVTIKGISPLLMHSDTFADPLDPSTKRHKALTSKRKKTDEDYEAIAKSEWFSSLYHDDKLGPYLPGLNIEACIFNAAALRKLTKVVKRAILVNEDRIKLEYDGPRDREGLWEDPRFRLAASVKVGMARLTRYRPKFDEWAATFTITYNLEQIDTRDLEDIVSDAGLLVGVCDWRPRFGKFSVEKMK